MTNVASNSNSSVTVNVNEAYPNPSHVIGPNIVTVKLSGKSQYNLWRIQMECLLKSQHMVDFIKGAENGKGKRKVGDMAMEASDSLVKGWILGSLSEEAATKAVNHLTHMKNNTDFTAKDLWDELQRSYGPSVREQAAEKELATRQTESRIEVNSESEDAKLRKEPTEGKNREKYIIDIFFKDLRKRWLYDSIIRGNTRSVDKLEDGLKPWDKFTDNGNTILHLAVGPSPKNHELLKKLLDMTREKYTLLDSDGNEIQNTLLDLVNSNGSTLLHVAAIGGNIKAVNMLVERNPELLLAKDKKGHTPLALSVSNMHKKTSRCLFEHIKVHGWYANLSLGQNDDSGQSDKDIKTSVCLLEQKKKEYDAHFRGKSGEDLVVLAISCQDFGLAYKIIDDYPDAILDDSDAVLTALAQNFPRELNFWERGWKEEFDRMAAPYELWNYEDSSRGRLLLFKILRVLFIGLWLLAILFYQFGKVLVRPFAKDTSQIYSDAANLSFAVCYKIKVKDNSSTYHQYYNSSIFEATRRNSSTFIRTIINVFPNAIWSINEDGHNFIQYSVINRSEKIYNLLYEMSEHKNIYKTIKDSSQNNLLHLAARLAPTNKLNLISGAALQIQRELQWFKEVERFVCPLNQIQKNLDDETPQEVFTREHKGLVIEGEKWIKKTAESYTITAALIITIVFAAAITVPGGNSQELGIPIFINNIAFKVFAISDAISLFTAVTSLLMFLSILTTRFAEQDFLFKLPTKLIIGLTMLFLSTTAMIIAFGATLFLVFGQSNSSMLIPIGALTCLPITSFVTLQFPLIVELIRATYCGGFFVREEYDYFY